MCGRFTLSKSTEEVAARFAIEQIAFDLTPRFNIAPGQPIAVVTQNNATSNHSRTLDAFKWGLVPFWAKDPKIGNKMINARAEGLAEKPSFKQALVKRRCLIPTDGFYEWMKKGKEKQPMHIHARSGEVLAFAGLWEEWKQPDGSPLRTCTIITTAPNKLMASIHNRMPAILRPEDEELWLDMDNKDVPELLQALKPFPDEALQAPPVATLVNNPAFDAPQCVDSVVDDESQS
jgi:putative SOS response-associated peptidase YedK